ncbi:MAG: bestrophin family ion channel [Cyanobacteria bacterium P01_A01_bin.114]
MRPFDSLAGRKPIERQPRVRSQRVWFSTLIRLQGSVVPAVMPRVLGCAAFGLLISILHQYNWPVSLPMLSGIVPSLVLGLLLVFRTNTAYERFWEGRKLWGTMVNVSRNLARQIWVAIEVKDHQERAAKQQALRLVAAFSVATKLWLRKPSVNAPDHIELQDLLTPEHYEQLQVMNHPPLEIAFWLGDYLQQQAKGRINPYQLIKLLELLDQLVNVLGGCERILKTPIPMAYSIHIKQLLLLYCLALPFQVVSDLGGWTAAIVGLVSFTVFGIEEIGIEIENPFGCDPNDLPLDEICQTMQRNIEDLMGLTPGGNGK